MSFSRERVEQALYPLDWRVLWGKPITTEFGVCVTHVDYCPIYLVEKYDLSGVDSYGYSDHQEAGMVFAAGGQYFKKIGEGSSYGTPDFNYGGFYEVYKKVRTVSSYE